MTTSELIAAIRRTNNGYIFDPSGAEMAAAKRNPSVFRLKPNSFRTLSIHLVKP